MVYTVYYSSDFKKSLKKYSSFRTQIEKKLHLFLDNPFDKRLKAHKLSGTLSHYWSFSVNYNLRIVFEFMDKETIGLVDIGTHAVYKKSVK